MLVGGIPQVLVIELLKSFSDELNALHEIVVVVDAHAPQEVTDALSALEARSATLEDRFMTRFTVMEVAISQLKSTGTYLTNLVDSWNNANQ